MFTLWERIYSPLQHHHRCRLSSKANHIVHKIQNLVCPEGFEPSTTWFQTKYATRLRYGQMKSLNLKLSTPKELDSCSTNDSGACIAASYIYSRFPLADLTSHDA